jgi:hypothetical protein
MIGEEKDKKKEKDKEEAEEGDYELLDDDEDALLNV